MGDGWILVSVTSRKSVTLTFAIKFSQTESLKGLVSPQTRLTTLVSQSNSDPSSRRFSLYPKKVDDESVIPPKVMDRRKSDRRANERRSDERRHHDRRSGSGEVARERRQREELVELTDRRLTDRRNQDRREHDRRKINLLLNPEAQELLTKTPWMEELLVKIAEDQTSSAEDQKQVTQAS